MKKSDIKDFFDKCAVCWDTNNLQNDDTINLILDNAQINGNISILDVACGTGVLFPYYLERGVKDLTAIDLSPKMTEIAKQKYPDLNIICGDVESACFNKKFDRIIVFNAFPHFPSPTKLIKTLAELVKAGGKIAIAHGLSRDALIRHHNQNAKQVSLVLPEAHALAKLCEPWFDVNTIISNNQMYQVVGTRKTIS